ncbi:MAG: sterile alpha motif-like domain-containing protein [Ruminococcus flavefaciens]|nr:sterile alpha motif-like domain-containing protein [Ruminococcus flavefaciens]
MVSFRKWMEQYKEECSPIGDLARDIAADDTFPKSSKADILFGYMEECGACESCFRAFYEAWGMYERERIGEKLSRREWDAYVRSMRGC